MHNKILNAVQFYSMLVRQTENSAVTYTINWSSDFPTGVTISSSSWSSEDSGVTIANSANTTLKATARISGDVGKYKVVNKVVDSAGDTRERILIVKIGDNNGTTYDYGYAR